MRKAIWERRASAPFAAVVVLSATALGHAAPRDEWATVTHAGNAPYVYQDFDLTVELGRVDHEYQIRKTEVTAGEWFEFVQAYAPYVPERERIGSAFTSQYVGIFYNPDNSVGYFLYPQGENRAVQVGWRNAARFCNWLHNNKALTRDAFDRGVYDTSTFALDAQGLVTDSTARDPGARFWLPSQDEWVKATYFDPDRYGPDQPGYWRFPNRSDVPLIAGPPGVGQTGAGWFFGSDLEVAAYVDQTSPWGLWDTSGGESEWLGNGTEQGHPLRGSQGGLAGLSFVYDRLEYNDDFYAVSTISLSGFRLARSVPEPAATCCVVVMVVACRRRRIAP